MRHGAGAEREADADFALARAGARQHEVGGVAADGQQQQQHDGLQDERAPPVSRRCGPRGACQNGSTSPPTRGWSSG